MNTTGLQWPRVVPGRVVPVGPQIVLGKVGHKVVALEGFAHKAAGLDWVVLEAVREDPGSHKKYERWGRTSCSKVPHFRRKDDEEGLKCSRGTHHSHHNKRGDLRNLGP